MSERTNGQVKNIMNMHAVSLHWRRHKNVAKAFRRDHFDSKVEANVFHTHTHICTHNFIHQSMADAE